MPVVSVAMTVFNSERYLAEAIESILAQTFADFEFIIVDDGSTDASGEILRRYAGLDPRIRLISQENRGISAARNRTLELAVGEFVAVMDSDDVALPERLALQVDYLRKHPDCVAVSSRVLFIDPDGDPIAEMFVAVDHDEIEAAHLAAPRGVMCHPASLLRRSAALQVGGYREDLPCSLDYDLFLKLGEIGELHNLPVVLLKYRQHLESIGHARWASQRAYAELALRDALQRRGLENRKSEDAGPPPTSRLYEKWASWALGAGNVATARKHAWRAFLRRPHRFESWRLAYCALRGR